MAKRKTAAAATQPPIEPDNQSQAAEPDAPATDTVDGGDAGGGEAGPTDDPGAPVARIGDIVHYYEREELVQAAERGRAPRPHAAIVTGIEELDGEPNLLQLAEFHPSAGLVIQRHVRYAAGPTDGGWRPTGRTGVATVPMSMLVEAVQTVARMSQSGELEAAAAKAEKNDGVLLSVSGVAEPPPAATTNDPSIIDAEIDTPAAVPGTAPSTPGTEEKS